MELAKQIIEAVLVVGAVCGAGAVLFIVGAALTGAVSVLVHRRDDDFTWIGDPVPTEPRRSPFAPKLPEVTL